jgi:uncharacterized membrane protein YkvA (DUF1232 family)
VLVLIATGRHVAARELAAFLPNLIALFAGLIRDARVPRRAKIALVLGVAYFSLPIDLVPDFVPVAGVADDAIVAALVLRFVVGAAGRDLVLEHWRGERATIERVLRLARL